MVTDHATSLDSETLQRGSTREEMAVFNPDKPLRITLISLHGLIRGNDPELGCDADTGGQVKYVLELARELGRHENVHEVEILTRNIFDP